MVGHAEMRIGKAIFMLADEFPQMGASSPETIGGSPVSLYIYVEDVDTFTEKAIAEFTRAIRLRTEASLRFEKGISPELALAGARRAATLLAEVCGGRVHTVEIPALPAELAGGGSEAPAPPTE